MESNQETYARLRWACRRGMLELDVILQPWLENNFADLSRDEQELFARFLESPDPDLFAWLMGYETPAQQFSELVARIRRYNDGLT